MIQRPGWAVSGTGVCWWDQGQVCWGGSQGMRRPPGATGGRSDSIIAWLGRSSWTMTERSLGGDSHQRLMAGKTQRFTSNRFRRVPRLERLTEQHWDVHLGQTLCDANCLSHSCQRKFNEFFSFSVCLFVYRVVPIEGFGRGNASTTVLHPWRLATHPRYPPHSRLCPHLPSTCIDLCAIKQCDSRQFFHFMQTKE